MGGDTLKKFSLFFSRDGYLLSTKFLYFFHEMGPFFKKITVFFVQGGYFFARILCMFSIRWVPFTQNFSVFSGKVGIFKKDFFPVFWSQSGCFFKQNRLYMAFYLYAG